MFVSMPPPEVVTISIGTGAEGVLLF